MKIKLLLISAFALVIKSNTSAQAPVITMSNSQTFGDSLPIYKVDTTGLTAGAAGTNITWDFSAIDSIGIVHRNTMAPSATPYPTLYPTANTAEKIISGTSYTYQFYNSSSDSFNIVGASGNLIDSTRYFNDDKSMVLPFTYTDSFWDSSIYTAYILGGYSNRSHQSRTTTSDGYGTLILPNGTFNNILRYYVDTYRTDSLFSGSSFMSVSLWYTREYFWVSQDYKGYLFYLNTIKNKNGVPQNTRSSNYTFSPIPVLSTASKNIAASDEGVVLYPNPVPNTFFIESNTVFNNAELTLYSISGQILLNMKNIEGKKISVNTVGLSKGLVYYTITQKFHKATGKFIIE
jgi:hypothetical protein